MQHVDHTSPSSAPLNVTFNIVTGPAWEEPESRVVEQESRADITPDFDTSGSTLVDKH